jgi:hypothetical protein
VEDNIRFIRLAFPVSYSKTWNGNAYNTLPYEEYYYSEISEPTTLGAFSFDSTLLVTQTEFISLINRIIKKERYAFEVGLIFKQNDSLNVNPLGQVLNGIEFRQTLYDYRR